MKYWANGPQVTMVQIGNNVVDFPMNIKIFEVCLEKRKNGMMVQQAFPRLNADFREFLISGIVPGKWDELFGEGPEHETTDYDDFMEGTY